MHVHSYNDGRLEIRFNYSIRPYLLAKLQSFLEKFSDMKAMRWIENLSGWSNRKMGWAHKIPHPCPLCFSGGKSIDLYQYTKVFWSFIFQQSSVTCNVAHAFSISVYCTFFSLLL